MHGVVSPGSMLFSRTCGGASDDREGARTGRFRDGLLDRQEPDLSLHFAAQILEGR